MTSCGATLRKLGIGATSMEEVANRTVRYLYDHLVDPQSNERSCVLIRLFKTHPYNELDLDLGESIREISGGVPKDPEMKCLTLLATAGIKPEWNDRRMSVGHRISPLSGVDISVQYPMFSQLIQQFGLDLDVVVHPSPALLVDLEHKTFNVFHVAEAAGSPYIPAQTDFVAPFAIQSVVGFGGMLPKGNLFTVILFSKVPIPRETAECFKTLALNVKMALLPFEELTIFNARHVQDSVPKNPLMKKEGIEREVVRLRSQVASLDQLLGVHEQVVYEQSDRNAQLYADTQQRLVEIEGLQRVTSALLQSRTSEEIFDVICAETQSLTGADTATLFLLQDENWLRIIHTKGNFNAKSDGIPVNGSFSGLAVRQKRPMLTNDLPNDPHAFLARAELQTLLVHPLIVKGVVIGSLNAINKAEGFHDDDVRILGLLADQAAIAIENARLHEQAEESAVLAERHRLARELHDSVTQSIYSVILFADATRLALKAAKTTVATENLQELQHMASTALADMRLLLYELHPPELAEEGLVSTLDNRLNAVESRAGLQVSLDFSGKMDLPLALESELYKIAQEALNNVVKHAHASAVAVQIDCTDDRFCLTIQDDGVGFIPDAVKPNPGLGLRSIHERVQQIEGELLIQSAPGEGTMLQVIIARQQRENNQNVGSDPSTHSG
ncbi:GAF domain-containing sensor histidine kinase [Chloroflexi bacterium TSY]|nr:GAF domain-containing sensor histidine kinase [Chloroflexi bacterium TSY]